MLLIGPPGTGKSMLAARLPDILPPMTDEEALESAALQSLIGGFNPARWKRPHISGAAPYRVGGCPGGRQQQRASRRDFPGASRRAVS
jgi:magnesium chelatase family protein